MNTKARFVLIVALALLGGGALAAMTQAAPGAIPLAQGGAPTAVSYQGEVRVNDDPYTGDGYFKFAVVNAAGDTTYWSNDGTGTGGGEPTAAVELAVSEGLFSVLLGDTTLGGMTQALTAGVFSQPDRYLRVWFSSDNITFDQLTPDTRIAAVPYALQAQEAVDADTVDGLHASELGAHYQNVVVVAKSGGDYTSVQAAIDSVADAAADNPYLVWVAPGVYSETVTMNPFVQATLILASDASLRDLTVGNSGAGARNVALMATAGMTRTLVTDVTARAQGGGTRNYGVFLIGSGTGVRVQGVTALAENGSYNQGLVNYSGAAATLRGGSFTARGGVGTRGIGIADSDTTLEAVGVTALAENGSEYNEGLINETGAAAVLRGGSFTGRAGADAYGIRNDGSSTALEAESVTALAENGSNVNTGLHNVAGSTATLHGGSFTGRGGTHANGINNADSDTTLEAESITALGENGSSNNNGLRNYSTTITATLHGGSFTGRGGTNARGIFILGDTATLEADSATALGEGGSSDNYGLVNTSSSATALAGSSQFTGSSNGLYQTAGTVRLAFSQLDGGATHTGGILTCYGVYDETYTGYTCP
jgi:hypothetical protein